MQNTPMTEEGLVIPLPAQLVKAVRDLGLSLLEVDDAASSTDSDGLVPPVGPPPDEPPGLNWFISKYLAGELVRVAPIAAARLYHELQVTSQREHPQNP